MGSTATSAVPAQPVAPTPARRYPSSVIGWLAAAIVASPELIAVAAGGFSIGPMLLLLANHFVPSLAIQLGFVGAVVALVCYGRPARPRVRGDVVWTLLAMLFVYSWIILNGHYASEDVYAIRDPSTYAIASRWLMDHQSLAIHTHPEIFGQPAGSSGVTSGGFNNIKHIPTVFAQGNHLLPVFSAMAGSHYGQSALFTSNVVFGGLALFVFFGLARRLLKSGGLALLATVVLGLLVPMIYVSRDSFSEPLTMLYLTGGLALLYRAGRSGRPRDYALAAFVAGCSAMLRVDSYASLVGFLAAGAVVGIVAQPKERRRAVLCGVAVVLGGVGPTVLGWWDVAKLSQEYYWSQHANILSLIKLLVALTIAVPVVLAVTWWTPVRDWLRRTSTRRWIGRGTIAALAVVFVALALRPWWYIQKFAVANENLKQMEISSGIGNPTGLRTYGDQTINWQAMYLGWPTVVLAVVGYCVLVHRLVRRREYALAGPLATGLALSALYLWSPQIYPDQPWAMRRYIPIVLPMLLIATMAGLRLLAQVARGRVRLPFPANAQPWTRRIALVAVVVTSVAAVVVPIAVLRPNWKIRQEGGQYQQLAALCAALPPNAAVVETDRASQTAYGMSIRAYCDVPSFGLPNQPSQEQLAAMSQAVAKHGLVLFSLASAPNTVPYAPGSGPQVFSTVTTTRWTTHIGRVPSGPRYDCISVYVAQIDGQGLASTLTKGGLLALSGPCAGAN